MSSRKELANAIRALSMDAGQLRDTVGQREALVTTWGLAAARTAK
jgi:hypothetical protein